MSLSVLAGFPAYEGIPSVQQPFLFFSSLPGVQVPSYFLFFFFPFHLPGYLETFLVLSSV